MAIVTLSSKNQITLPAELMRALGLKQGDKLVAELIDDHIVLLPRPESWVDYFKGSMKGFWGTHEEIDRYMAEERRSRERDEWLEQFDDFVATDEEVRVVVEALKSFPRCTADPNELHTQIRLSHFQGRDKLAINKMLDILEKLGKHGVVRKVPQGEGKADGYRLAHELANR